MSDYKRLFSYLYYYDQEIKEKNAGFLKVEIRNGQCRAQISVRGGFLNRASGWGVYGFKREEEGLHLWPLGQLMLRPGQGEWSGQMTRDRFLGAAGCLEEVAGVLLCAGEADGGYIADLAKWSGNRPLCATVWDDLPLFAPKEILHAAGIGEDDAPEQPVAAAGVEQQEWEILRGLLEEREVETIMTGRETYQESVVSPSGLKNVPGSVWPGSSETLRSGMPEQTEPAEKSMTSEQTGASEPLESINRTIISERDKEPELPEPMNKNFELGKPGVSGEREAEKRNITPEQGGMPGWTEPAERNVTPEQTGTPEWTEPADRSRAPEQTEMPKQVEPERENAASKQAEPKEKTAAPKQAEPAEEPADLERRRAMRMGQEDRMECPCPEQCAWRNRYREPPRSVWEGLSRQYPKLLLNGVNNGWEILKIMPGDIGRLPRENWVYGNNSFLLHGYYRYHHLILACYRGAGYEQYYLGVPGPGHGRERVMASMFGFTNYLPAGKYGYWYTPINLGNN